MKPKTVIFSSLENLEIARDFANALHEKVDCTVWKDLPFALASYTQKDLAVFGEEYDFALLIFGYEDNATIRDIEYKVTRDNVVYELGLMSGLIGSDRCFIIDCISNSSLKTQLPTDITGITTVRFDTDSTNRNNIILDCARSIISNINTRGPKKHVNKKLMSQLSVVGLSAFYTDRSDFRLRKADDGSSLEKLKDYLSIANKSIKNIVFTFAQGVVFENLCELFKEKLKASPDFNITISLLNPYDSLYYSSCCMTHNRKEKSDDLIAEANRSIRSLREFRNSLSSDEKKQFNIKFHNTALFEPAILIDENEDNGRIQVEIHPYRADVFDRYAFEVKKSNDGSNFYNKLKTSYNQLLDEAVSLDEIDF